MIITIFLLTISVPMLILSIYSIANKYRKRENLGFMEIQIAGRYLGGIYCKSGYNSLMPFPMQSEHLRDTKQDTLYGDLKIGISNYINYYNYYVDQKDLSIDTGKFILYYKVYRFVVALDNVLIQQFTQRQKIYYRIVRIERNGVAIFEDKDPL